MLYRASIAALFALALPACAESADTQPFCIGGQVFQLEIANTQRTREHGLMGRTSLNESDGMFFGFDRPYRAQMWMKDTPLSLDMVFVDAAGKVMHIVDHTQPYSETIIDSGGATAGVIELEAGRAKRQGITEGAEVAAGNCDGNAADASR